MSEGQGNPKKDPEDEPSDDPILELKEMFQQFLAISSEIQFRHRTDIGELKNVRLKIKKSNLKSPLHDEFIDTPLPDRNRGRRSSRFFGMPNSLESLPDNIDKPDMPMKPDIQVLQADIVYDKELKMSSLEGLQYLSLQIQLLSSKYPGRDIKMAHMVWYNLHPHVLASWNSHQYRKSVITGAEPKEVIVEDYLSLTNSVHQAILVEAARPRIKELYSKELVLFLGKGIP